MVTFSHFSKDLGKFGNSSTTSSSTLLPMHGIVELEVKVWKANKHCVCHLDCWEFIEGVWRSSGREKHILASDYLK